MAEPTATAVKACVACRAVTASSVGMPRQEPRLLYTRRTLASRNQRCSPALRNSWRPVADQTPVPRCSRQQPMLSNWSATRSSRLKSSDAPIWLRCPVKLRYLALLLRFHRPVIGFMQLAPNVRFRFRASQPAWNANWLTRMGAIRLIAGHGMTISISEVSVHGELVSGELQSFDDALPPKQGWKSALAFGLLATSVIVTIIWAGLLCTLAARLVWSFF